MFGIKQMVVKKITIIRWRVNIWLVFWVTLGIISTSYFLITNIKQILAFNGTTNIWTISVGTSNAFTFDTNLVTVGDSGAQPIENVNKIINPSFDSDTGSWNLAAVGSSATPEGWVVVPGNSTFGTSDFLAMKYEAKCVETSTPGVGLTAPANTTYNVYRDDGAGTTANNCTAANGRAIASLASGYPITYISLSEANTRCGSVAMGVGASAHLISANEWMTIARDAEAQNSNWSLGVVGSGYLYAGHNDNQPVTALQASTNDAYRAAFTDIGGTTEAQTTATNNNSGQSGTTGNQVRTFNLSNNSVIWDIAGNVREWNNQIQTTAVDITAAGVDWNHANIAAGARALYGSNNYLSAEGMGQVYGGAIGNGFVRGGRWSDAGVAGAFNLILSYSPSTRLVNLGFRCASDAVAISQSFSSSFNRGATGANLVTVGSLTDAKLIQSINVGNTATYDFSVYVYDNTVSEIGATITSDIAQLYYNGATILTTYTNGGNGWWKLTGSVTGANEAKDFGVLIKAGKTVAVDDFTLSRNGIYSIYTTTSYSNNNLSNWDSFTASVGATNDAGVVYQICADDGSICESNIGTTATTWQYWNGSAWTVATNSTTDVNSVSVINQNINTFTVATKKISVKAIMSFGGSDLPTISSFTVGLTTDTPTPTETPTPTPTETPTPTPTEIPTPTPTLTPSNSSPDSGLPDYNCHSSKPLFISDLFQVDASSTKAKIYFTPQRDTNDYFVSFSSVNNNAEEHGEAVTLLREGVQSHTIYSLKPNTTYYIKVRGQNGCMPGDWSTVMKFKTGSLRSKNIIKFYKYTKLP